MGNAALTAHDARGHEPLILPDDEHNRTLVQNTHPPDWVNPEPRGRYNLVVIGSGTAGLTAAGGCAAVGGRVALIERHMTGGDCLISGCVPSKGIIRSARVAAMLRQATDHGLRVPEGTAVDFRRSWRACADCGLASVRPIRSPT